MYVSYFKQTLAKVPPHFIALLTSNVLMFGNDAIMKKTVQVEKMKPDVVRQRILGTISNSFINLYQHMKLYLY